MGGKMGNYMGNYLLVILLCGIYDQTLHMNTTGQNKLTQLPLSGYLHMIQSPPFCLLQEIENIDKKF